MTEIGFYHLQRVALDRALPRLLETIVERGHRTILMTGSPERLEALDALLWTYEQGSWLPHGSARAGSPERQPIYLTSAEENPNGADVLVVVDGVRPGFLGSFARAVDMFDGRDEAAVQAARERWRDYRDAGHGLTYWRQRESGGWEKKIEAGGTPGGSHAEPSPA